MMVMQAGQFAVSAALVAFTVSGLVCGFNEAFCWIGQLILQSDPIGNGSQLGFRR